MASSDDLYSTLQDSDVPDDQPSDPSKTDSSVDGEPSLLSFDAEQLDEQLRTASEDAGIVQFYNHYGSELSDIDPSEPVGKDSFTQLAPCSNNNLFLGRFEDGVHTDDVDEHFT